MIGGVAVGAASMTSPMYIAEISPARIRGRMVSVNQLAIVLGMLVVYFVNYFIASAGDEAWNVATGWRWMFGSEALPAVALLGLLAFVPESPRWLVKQGDVAKARQILTRVDGAEHAAAEIAQIESALAQESTSLSQLLRPGMRIVLVIGIVLAVLQQVTGINVFLYYATEIFKTIAGEATAAALLQTIVVGGVNLLFTLIAIWSVDKLGRKPLMMVGSAGMGLTLTALGLTAYYGRTDLWVLAFILGYIACFALSVGPGHLGDSCRDLSDEDPRPGDGDRHVLSLGGQFRRLADLSHDGRQPVARRPIQSRLSVLGLCRILPGAAAVCMAVRAGDERADARTDRAAVELNRVTD